MFRLTIILVIIAVLIVFARISRAQDHWGTWDDGDVEKVTVLEGVDDEYDYSVKEPELSFDGSRLYFNNAGGETPDSGMDLFMAEANDGNYGTEFLIDADAMDNVNSDYHEMAPCVNSDETKFFFTSKRPLGNQETWNVWVSIKNAGTWALPVALPGDVNDCVGTTGCWAEIGPNFVDEDERLYFSSNRPYDEHTEQGHFRLWISIWDNVAYEFNVDEDETYDVLALINVEGKEQFAPGLTYTGDSLYFTFGDPDVENDPENPHPREAFILEGVFEESDKIEDIYPPNYDSFEGPSIACDKTGQSPIHCLYFHGKDLQSVSGSRFDTFRTVWIEE